MKAAPYGSYSNIEYEDAAGYKDGGRPMNPQRYHGFPAAVPNLQSADINSDRALDQSNLIRLKNSYPLNENGNRSQGTSFVPDWRRKKGEIDGLMRNTRWNGEGAGYPKSNYQEAPSNYFHGSSNSRLGESPGHNNEYLERDRAELLRKLSELEDQLVLSGSGSVGERGKQRHLVERSKYHHESFGSSGDWRQYNSSISSSASRMADKRFTNVSPYHEKHPYNERHNVTMRSSYHSSGSSNDINRHGEYFDSQIPRSGTTSTPGQYQEYSPYRSHLPLQSADTADPRMSGSPHHYNTLHQPDCSCFHCYNSNLNSPLPVQSRSPVNTRYTDLSSNPKLYHQKDAQLRFNSENSCSPVAMGGQINHGRWPSALDSTVDEGVRLSAASTTSVKVKRNFHSIAGGAPFVTCSNCFELLQLRRQIMKRNNQQQKIRCGACSSLTYIFVEGKKLVFSIHKESMEKSKEKRCGSNMNKAKEKSKDVESISNEAVEEMLNTRGPSQTSKSFHSNEFCCSVHDEGIGDLEQVEHSSNIALEGTKKDPNKSEDSSTGAVEKILTNHRLKNEDKKNLHCDDLNRSRCESPLMDNAPVLSVPIYVSLSNKSLDAPGVLSAVDSEHDNPDECATAQKELANSDDGSEELVSPSSTISARQDHHGYAPSKHAVYLFGTHSQIIRAQNEKKGSEKSTPNTNVAREITAETEAETEVQQRETPQANNSLDTIGGSKFEDPPTINSGGFVAENVRDRVMRLAKSISIQYAEEKYDVRINEHPIPDHLVKKAEDLAGPILPGNYWYDFRAGFWGVIGGPCLGIIPPKIHHFGYPISKNCSGGTTGVIVNGRELHKKDLALLHSRGLPIERGKSYILEISGRLQDENSGEELRSLGPLAPTIERLKRGFGMRVSRNQPLVRI